MNEHWAEQYDLQLIAIILFLVAFGSVIMYSASSPYAVQLNHGNMYFLKRHMVFLGIGLACMLFFSLFPYKNLKPLTGILVGLAFLMLILGFVLNTDGGASRWLIYAGGRKMITVSDFVRLALIVYTARYIEKVGVELKNFKSGLLPFLVVTSGIILLIARQPDMSTALVTGMFVMVMLFIGGARIWHLALIAAGAVPAAIGFIMRNSYMVDRIRAMFMDELDPGGVNYQANISRIALGNGGLLGKGIGDSFMKQGFLPEAHNDYIFSVIGEELGFIFTAVIMVVFIWLFYRGIQIAKQAPDMFGLYLALGITLSVVMYFIVNVAYVSGLLPSTGLPMPLISYGGSNIICTLAALGILLNISRAANDSTRRWSVRG